ncbi:hypothetical protein B0H11DRAFT_1939824 [Mycena galericulata]|nr:hypothetical protein B0H11DRAFT_1939824 [Mycena galericulata]
MAESLTVLQFGRLSDIYGRRPILLLTHLGPTVSMLGFGLSKTFWTFFTFRCVQGAFNGNIGNYPAFMATRTWINEDCSRSVENGHERASDQNSVEVLRTLKIDSELSRTQAVRAGSFPEPGFANRPYKYRGHVLHDAASVEHWFDDETLPSAVARAKSKRRASPRETDPLLSTVESADFPETEPTAPDPLRQLITRPVLIAVLNHAFLNFCSMSYDALVPLVYATPIGLGGLGLTRYSIGLLMGLCGISNAFVQGLFGGRIIRYVGPRRIYTGCFCVLGLAYAPYPLLSFFACRPCRRYGYRHPSRPAKQLVFRLPRPAHGLNIDTKRATTILFIIDSAPDKANIGSVNGLVQMVGTILRAVAPSFASSLFALSTKNNLAGGYLVYIILVGFTLVACFGFAAASAAFGGNVGTTGNLLTSGRQPYMYWIAYRFPTIHFFLQDQRRKNCEFPVQILQDLIRTILVLVGDLSVQLASAWRTLRSLDAENDLDAWKFDGLKVLWALLALYLQAAASVSESFAGFKGPGQGRLGACEELAHQPELVQLLFPTSPASAGSSAQRVQPSQGMAILTAIHLHFLLAVSTHRAVHSECGWRSNTHPPAPPPVARSRRRGRLRAGPLPRWLAPLASWGVQAVGPHPSVPSLCAVLAEPRVWCIAIKSHTYPNTRLGTPVSLVACESHTLCVHSATRRNTTHRVRTRSAPARTHN